ncbi:exo-beta-1,3-glucanase [Kockovaella imperatae]|uniref:glucan 1,3-beta-glucosidase n=1 Tax=Kockovaella imperatae TaxID=4999 RepID=A0A1Y1UF36_9TREE|nr:exo-beta-1,3-glucanase [Kockovaella imperatae]ORX35685.1 exo-beta-1,3-glucanase [Kockovaella imperatae]
MSSPYTSLGGRGIPDSQLLSPEGQGITDSYWGRSGNEYMPAPSIISRDSTHGSLAGGAGGYGSNRNSWGSGMALAAAAGTYGDDSHRPLPARGSSRLATSSPQLSVSDEFEEQGHVAPNAINAPGTFSEKSPRWAGASRPKKSRKALWIGIGIGAFLVIGAGVGLGVYFSLRNKNNSSSSGSSQSGADNDQSGGGSNEDGSSKTHTGGHGQQPSAAPTSGGQGSLLTFEDGSTATYNNPYGGTWVWDPSDPFNNDAQVNSWTPALNQNWTWGQDKVMGVNLGGWLNTEPFIVPGLYQQYAQGAGGQAVDEYTLSLNMGDDLETAMTQHYDTFITEADIAEIASVGLNWIRLPIGHWAVETWPGEPFLERVSWTYVLKAIQWCRKYGIRINLDLHTVPGSQNGWNHSGKLGSVNWMFGTMGLANAQRSLDYMRTLAEFISQPEYAPVVQMFGFVNEPNSNVINKTVVASFYQEAYREIRSVTGIGAGNGPFLSIHDAFAGFTSWFGFLPGADRLALDQHPYLVFGTQQTGPIPSIAQMPCQYWAADTNTSAQQFGVSVAGEFSAAINDCGLYVNNVGVGTRYEGTYPGYNGPTGGSCDQWNNWQEWNETVKQDLQLFVQAEMDALQDYFFWTWKIGNSTTGNPQPNPFWHYKLGVEQGWINPDPRTAFGTCASFGTPINAFDGIYPEAYMTGGAGAGQIPATVSASYPWPVPTFSDVNAAQMTNIPQYTMNASPITLPGPTFTNPSSGATISPGSGWANSADTRPAFQAVQGCSYPPEYSATGVPIVPGMCGAGLDQVIVKRNGAPAPTPAPVV